MNNSKEHMKKMRAAKASAEKLPGMNEAIGDHWLSAWQVQYGETCVQSRLPAHTRRLAARQDGNLVATGVAGGYLRTYSFPHNLAWARDLIARYTPKLAGAGAQSLPPSAPQTLPKGLSAEKAT